MNEEFTRDPERALQTTPVVYLGEASRAAASFNHALERRPAGQSDGSGNLAAIVAADRAFPAAVAELGR